MLKNPKARPMKLQKYVKKVGGGGGDTPLKN